MAHTDDPEIAALSQLPPEELNEELAQDIARRWDPDRLMQLVAARAGKGEALDQSLRSRYEKKLGIDLGHVRIYTGEFAEEFNRTRGAEAVTIGGTGMILMGNVPERSMATSSGHALLAHELTHVAQAQRGLHNRERGDLDLATDEHEVEAQEAEASEAAEQSGGDAHTEFKQVEGNDLKGKELAEQVTDKVLHMLGDALRTAAERAGPRWRRP